MEFRIWVETRLDDRFLERELVYRVERPACGIGPEEIGLTLEEGKAVLRKAQARIVQTQVDMLGAARMGCCQWAGSSASRICAPANAEWSPDRALAGREQTAAL